VRRRDQTRSPGKEEIVMDLIEFGIAAAYAVLAVLTFIKCTGHL
jgi:hypothetical protein